MVVQFRANNSRVRTQTTLRFVCAAQLHVERPLSKFAELPIAKSPSVKSPFMAGRNWLFAALCRIIGRREASAW